MADILRRVSERVPLVDVDAVREIDTAIRQDWGGERPYIAKQGESARADMDQRNARIREQHRRGERVPLLARRWGITERRVRRIVNGS